MVVFDGATFLNDRWEQVEWRFCTWASEHLLLTAYKFFWRQSAFLLRDPYIRVQDIFTAQLGELLLLWAYRWLRGDGGFFLKGADGGIGRLLYRGMRLVELADFSLLFHEKMETLRAGHEVCSPALLKLARTTLKTQELGHFMVNFSPDQGFFTLAASRWSKWMERHQELLLSMARLGRSPFYAWKVLGGVPMEYPVGQQFARAFLHVVWSEKYRQASRTQREETYRVQLGKNLEGATKPKRKDELTFGRFSLFDGDEKMRKALEQFAEPAHAEAVVDVDAPESTSKFAPLLKFGPLYEMACHRFYFVPIHQQLVESFFSKFDTCPQKTDTSVFDSVRCGQFRSQESRHITNVGATGEEICGAGKRAISSATAAIAASYKCAELPAARFQKVGVGTRELLERAETRRSRVRVASDLDG